MVVGEGDGSVTVPVTLSAPGLSTVTVQYSVFNSTAVAGSDYTCPVVSCNRGTLTFAPGETAKTVRVDLLNDAMPEGMETFFFNLTTPSATGTIARAVAHVTIIDNDTTVATPQLFVRSATVDERAGTVRIPVVMGGPAGQASTRTVTVQYSTQPETAVAPADYTTTAGTLTFAPGQTVKTIAIPITNDTLPEAPDSSRSPRDLDQRDHRQRHRHDHHRRQRRRRGRPAAITPPPTRSSEKATATSTSPCACPHPARGPVAVDYETLNSSAGAATACFGD